MNPESLLQKLQSDSTPKIIETLKAIFDVCQEQQDRGINDFSISTIAKLGHMRGVPKAQSIRNKSGEKYRALINCFSEQKTNKKLKVSKSDEDWIEEISNPKHKLLARILASELKSAKKQLQEIIPPNLRIDVYDHKTNIPSDDHKLSEQERRALEYISSSAFQKDWGLSSNEYGEIVDNRNKPVFKVATIDALKKALRNL